MQILNFDPVGCICKCQYDKLYSNEAIRQGPWLDLAGQLEVKDHIPYLPKKCSMETKSWDMKL